MNSSPRSIERLGAYTLIALYAACYFGDMAAPGNWVEYPLGWWGWWDQSNYLASARNLLTGNLAPQGHWYPLGYPLLAAPFVAIWPKHGFFFLDLGCLLAAYAGFLTFTRRIGVTHMAAVPIFVLTSFGYPSVAETWAEPWTSTLSAALIWLLLGHAVAAPDDKWRGRQLLLVGLLAASLALVRPADLILGMIIVLFVLIVRIYARNVRIADIGYLAIGIALVTLPYLALHLSIYGFHATPYMRASRDLGFVFPRLGWKTYLLLIEPRPWYPQGQSLLAAFPWLVLSFAEMLLTVLPWHPRQWQPWLILLAVLIAVYWTLYFGYTDLLPSGIWRFHLIHYLKWTLPGLGLFAWLFVSRIWRHPRWYHAAIVAALVTLLSIRFIPERASASEGAEMVQYLGAQLSLQDSYLHEWQFRDDNGSFGSMGARALPDSQGVRILPQRRPVVGTLTWSDGPIEPGRPNMRWKAQISAGYPCWLPPYPCRRLRPAA